MRPMKWKNIITIFIVGIFILVGFSTMKMTADGSDEPLDEEPIANGFLSGELNLATDEADMKVVGSANYDYLGSGVQSGDVNGDGYDDMIVGARGQGTYSGAVYIYFGMTTIGTDLKPSDADVEIDCAVQRSGYAGGSIGIGDVNKDGIDDILIGSRSANSYTGEAYLIFGKSTWTSGTKITKADIKFKGERGYSSSCYFGENVWIADLDNDGYDDVIVVEPYYYERYYRYIYEQGVRVYRYNNYTGLTFVFWGKSKADWGFTGTTVTVDANNGEWDLRIKGWSPAGTRSHRYAYMGYNSGQAISAGDFDGDGYNDLAICSYRCYIYRSSYSYYSYAGATWLIPGRSRAEWTQWGGHYDLMDRQGDYMMFSRRSSSAYAGQNVRLMGDINGDGYNDLFVGSYRGTGSYNGKIWCIFGRSNTTYLKTGQFYDSYPYGGYYHDLDNVANITFTGRSNSYMSQSWMADFNDDGYDDVLLGAGRQAGLTGTSYAGAVHLIYGRSTDEWEAQGAWTYNDADWSCYGETTYSYLGYYSYQTLGSGDFNADGIADILMGAYGYRPNNNYYKGAAYMVLSKASDVSVQNFTLLDGDGENNDVMTMEAGGIGYQPDPEMGQVGDGYYTFKVAYNDSWTVKEVKDIDIFFDLKEEFLGLSYHFRYAPLNDSFFIVEGLGGGIQLDPEKCEFRMIDFHNAEVYFSIRITSRFLTQSYFDVTARVRTARQSQIVTYDNYLRVEMDLTFDKDDMKVLMGEREIQRGEFLSGGLPLVVTGLRVVYEGTDVSPMNDKFSLRIIDSYGRIFENTTSGGYDIYFEIPTNVDSGKYSFAINIIINPIYVEKIEDLSIIPDFYVALDFIGPDAPPNLAFHADTEIDPEGRWDNDEQVWATWDPAYDTQSGIDHYEYMVEGPGGFFYLNSTSDLMIELELAGDGIYNLYVWAVDNVGNPGARAMKTFVKDSVELIFSGAVPSYTGGIWFNSKDVTIIVKVNDIVQHHNGPHIKLSTLQYALTQSMTEAVRDDVNTVWKRPIHTVIHEEKEGIHYTYTLSVKIPNLVEGTNNYVWFKVMDEAGNEGMTNIIDTADTNYEENATIYNPSNVWVDITALTYTDPLPSTEEQPIVENIVTASVVINDLGAGVDATSIQYSVSRNGLTNYGGWISANLNTDDDAITAKTVAELLFQPGSTNYIRWRAKDVAGNGYTISEDFPITTMPREINNPPVAEISQPVMQAVYNTKDTITFDASSSSDPDFDTLSYRWVLANKELIGEEATFDIEASELERGVHVVTLYISDGEYTVTDSISIYIKQHVDEVDTDNDGIADGADSDDDNDGLLDTEEAIKGTNPRLKDSDYDGVNDKLDEQPLNPEVGLPDETEGEYSYWDILTLFLILAVFIILIGAMVVFKRRSNMEKERVMRNVTQEGKIVQRYEVLTGIEAPLLPQVKEMGVSLPPVAAQQVAPIKRARSLSETPSLPPTEETPAPEPAPAPIEPTPEPAPAPEPKPVRRERSTATPGSTPGAVPTPEELTATAALPGEGEPAQSTNCDLCGSAIDVPAGATSVECPLCGEQKNL